VNMQDTLQELMCLWMAEEQDAFKEIKTLTALVNTFYLPHQNG
jgi:dsDNA-binding SOS-regulon protein